MIFVYDAAFRGKGGMRALIPSVMTGGVGSFDDRVTGEYWVLPYDLEMACGKRCDRSPSQISAPCNAELAERSTPFLRRDQSDLAQPGVIANVGALWTARAGRTLTWNPAGLPHAGSLIQFQGGACVNVEGELNIQNLGLTALESPWNGVQVGATGYLKMTGSQVSMAGNNNQITIPGAIRTSGGRVRLTGVAVASNSAPGVYAAGKGAEVIVDGASEIIGNRIPFPAQPGVETPGVWADAQASVTIAEQSRVLGNRGPGVRATGSGTVVVLDAVTIESNGFVSGNAPLGAGVEASDGAEVFFAAPDGSGNPRSTSLVLNNVRGGVSSSSGASVVAGISDGTVCMRYCGNQIVGNAQQANLGGFDARAVTGGTTFAEANYWGAGITSPSQLKLLSDAASHLSVAPLLTTPPSLQGEPGAGRVAGSPEGAGPAGHREGHPWFAQARARLALSDTPGAFDALGRALRAVQTPDERRAAFSTAVSLLASGAPLEVVSWLDEQASRPGSPARPWALRALVVARDADRQAVLARAAAVVLTAEFPATEHGVAGHAARVRFAVEDGAPNLALQSLGVLQDWAPGSLEVASAFAQIVAAFPDIHTGATLRAPSDASLSREGLPEADVASLDVAPNPFTGTAAIALVLVVDAAVELTLHDALGRVVAILYDGSLPAGRHALATSGANLAPGIYVVLARIRTGSGTFVRAVRLVHAR